MAIKFQLYFAFLSLWVGAPSYASVSVWTPYTQPEEVNTGKLTTVADFIKSNIEPKYESYVENGGFEQQWPEAPNGPAVKGFQKSELVLLDEIDGPASEFEKLNQSDFSSENLEVIPEDSPAVLEREVDIEIVLNSAGKVQITPKVILFDSTGTKLHYNIASELIDGIRIYTRDDDFIEINFESQFLVSKKSGESEIFIVYDEDLQIVPVLVQEDESKIKVPVELTSVADVGKLPFKASAGYRSAKTTNSYSITGTDSEKTQFVATESNFSIEELQQTYSSVVLQILDERSSGLREKLYPVGHAKIQIVGTDFTAKTDNRGLIELRDLPQNSEILVRVADDDGLLQPSLFALSSNADAKKIVMRKSTFETLQDMAHVAQNSFLGSLCFNAIDSEGLTAEGIELSIDAPAVGPFYFNKYGFIDLSQKATGPNGRACFFNIEPGSTAVHSSREDEFIATRATSAHAGLHIESDLEIFTSTLDEAIQIVPALTGSAHAQLRADHELLADTKRLEWASLVPLGSGQELAFVKDGALLANDSASIVNGYVRLLSQSSDFEEMILHLPVNETASVVAPLLPRGYIEDMAYYAQKQVSPFDGQVLVDHNVYSNFDLDDVIEVSLYDSLNQKPAEPWMYKDGKMTKTLFFNLRPGLYSIIVKTQSGYWVDSRNVLVYSSTVSYVTTGAALIWNDNNSEK